MTTRGPSAREEILDMLSEEGEVLQKSLHEFSEYSQSHVSKVLCSLEDDGVVRREQEGRSKKVRVSEQGEAENAEVDRTSRVDPLGTSEETIEEIRELRNNGDETDEVTFDEGLLEEEESGREGIHRDDAYQSLRRARRRDVIRYLDDIGGPVNQGELAEEIAALENDKGINELNSKERKRVYINLYQHQLEKLYEIAVVELDRGEVSRGQNFEILSGLVGNSFEERNNDIKYNQQSISTDDLFSVLSNSRRRDVIRYFSNTNNGNDLWSEKSSEEIKLSELATKIASIETGKDEDEITGRDKKSVYVCLYSDHLEILDEEDIIEYDEENNVIRPGENLDLASQFVGDSFFDCDEYLTEAPIKIDETTQSAYWQQITDKVKKTYDRLTE